MKKEELPQDPSALGRVTKEVCYVTDPSGKYLPELSSGWEIKVSALEVAWKGIEERKAAARKKVLEKKASPILFFMENSLMGMSILSSYTGFSKWRIKRHFKPKVFDALPDSILKKYAEVFNVSTTELKNMKINET